MHDENIECLLSCVRDLPEPANLYEGVRLPENFALPDEILLFYHDYCAPAPNAHCRYTLVFPLAEMHYYADEREFDLAPGDVLLIRPFSLRFLSPDSAGYQRLFITFQLPAPQAYLPEKMRFRLTGETLPYLRTMRTNYPDGDPGKLALALFGFLTHLEPGGPARETRRTSRQVARAVEYINDHIHVPLENRAIAERVSMSPSNLSRRFRREMGISVHDYIGRQRLEFARYYLAKTLMPMDEIARRCGFLSNSSFSHFFKQRTGLSPLAFRKQ